MGKDTSYRVKVNPSLFDEGKALRHTPLQLISIIQNDMEISHEELVAWNAEVKKYVEDIKAWRLKVLEHIDNCNI